ncbi:MAG: helix-turn-helix transcriptional regulator [Schleiferilactobacillus harbinensis]|jgi:transcriptional regulator with XRE-family HTH domain|nr:helix-turn-helix transcriptional regulator [Schleiferilactobacillus harbinensis]MCI1911951.1 helix-turn-helix transcriptional regulator [Schleiferilactobacillus harbinensis]
MNEKVLGHFLRYKRLTANPAAFGIVRGPHRRTSGLRREEVAERAHVSVDWYARIEQGRRDSNPSPEVLAALGRALQLKPAELNYAFNLIGQRPTTPPEPGISDGLKGFLQAQGRHPAYIMDRNFTLVAWNDAYTQIYGDLTGQSTLRRNAVWRVFHDPFLRTHVNDWREMAHWQVARFRQIYSTAADSPFLFQVFTAIKEDPVFHEAWDQLAVADPDEQYFFVDAPDIGELYFVETTLQTTTGTYYVAIQNSGDTDTEKKLTQQGD